MGGFGFSLLQQRDSGSFPRHRVSRAYLTQLLTESSLLRAFSEAQCKWVRYSWGRGGVFGQNDVSVECLTQAPAPMTSRVRGPVRFHPVKRKDSGRKQLVSLRTALKPAHSLLLATDP